MDREEFAAKKHLYVFEDGEVRSAGGQETHGEDLGLMESKEGVILGPIYLLFMPLYEGQRTNDFGLAYLCRSRRSQS